MVSDSFIVLTTLMQGHLSVIVQHCIIIICDTNEGASDPSHAVRSLVM